MTPASAAPLSLHRFAFTGRTRDYFRIWMISLCLSLLTLGIYSAWAKVRKRRYLFAHTKLDGSGFEYRAAPLAILKGRVIALALFGGFALSGHFLLVMQIAFVALLILLTPWIVVASSRFNARNSAYRNVAFAFDGTVREAAKVILGFGVLALLTAGLGYPWFRMRRARFMIERHRFGATPFSADLAVSGFIVAYLLAALMLIGALVLMFGVIAATFWIAGGGDAKHPPAAIGYIPVIGIYAVYLGVFAYLRARVGNLTQNGTIVGPLRCHSTLRARDLNWLYLSNIVAVIATVGFAIPWVTIRMARYRANNLAVAGIPTLAAFTASSGSAGTATGSEVGDLFDVEVSL